MKYFNQILLGILLPQAVFGALMYSPNPYDYYNGNDQDVATCDNSLDNLHLYDSLGVFIVDNQATGCSQDSGQPAFGQYLKDLSYPTDTYTIVESSDTTCNSLSLDDCRLDASYVSEFAWETIDTTPSPTSNQKIQTETYATVLFVASASMMFYFIVFSLKKIIKKRRPSG